MKEIIELSALDFTKYNNVRVVLKGKKRKVYLKRNGLLSFKPLRLLEENCVFFNLKIGHPVRYKITDDKGDIVIGESTFIVSKIEVD